MLLCCQTGSQWGVSLRTVTNSIRSHCQQQDSHQLSNNYLLWGNWYLMGRKETVFSISRGPKMHSCLKFEHLRRTTAAQCWHKKTAKLSLSFICFQGSLFRVLCAFLRTVFLSIDQSKYLGFFSPTRCLTLEKLERILQFSLCLAKV